MFRTLIAGAALAALCAVPAAAATKAKGSPKAPIPYAQLDAYSKASAKDKASKDWWAGTAFSATAPTGTAANVSAMEQETSATSPMTVNPAPNAAGTKPSGPAAATIEPPMTPSSGAAMPSGQGEAGEATSGSTTTPQ